MLFRCIQVQEIERIAKVEVTISEVYGVKLRILDEDGHLLNRKIEEICAESVRFTGRNLQSPNYAYPAKPVVLKALKQVTSSSRVFHASHDMEGHFHSLLKAAIKGKRLQDVILKDVRTEKDLKKTFMKFVKQGNWRKLWVLTEMDLLFVERVIAWWRSQDPNEEYRSLACKVPASFEVAAMKSQCEKDGGFSFLPHPKNPKSSMRISWEGRVMVVDFNYEFRKASDYMNLKNPPKLNESAWI